MVAAKTPKPMPLAEFVEFALRPENSDREFEFVNGEMVEKMPGRSTNSYIGHLITVAVHLFCREHKLPCFTSGGDAAYRVGEAVVAPDFAYKPTPMIGEYPDPEPPLWVVEIISPTDKPYDIRAKRLIYIEANILYWELYPQSQSIDIYAPGQSMRTVGIDDMLDSGDVLPGFTLPVKELFLDQPNS
jgi:Uma2 family endonuclease